MLKKIKPEIIRHSATTRVLTGYKEIASFLGVSTRTLQRHLKNIPVSRLGKKIIILESELIHWVKTSSSQNEFKV